MLGAAGQLERAVELATLAHEHKITDHEIKSYAAELLDELQAELGAHAYNAAWQRGRQLDLDTVVQQLLDEFEDG